MHRLEIMTKKHKLSSILWRLAVGTIGGFVSSLAMPRENIWPLIFVSVAMMLVAIRGLGFWAAVGVGFASGMAFYLSQIEWISLYLGPVPWVALSVMESLIFAVGAGVLSQVWLFLNQRLKGPLASTLISLSLATIWTAREWVSTNLPYGGFPWSRVAQALSDSFLSQLVFFVGISGLTFLSVFITLALLQFFEKGLKDLWNHLPALTLSAVIVAIAVLFPVPIEPQSGSVTVAAVQGNANAGLFANAERGTFLRNHLEATELLSNHPRRNEIDFIVWPENASDINPQTSPAAKLQIQSVVEKLQVPLILGAITESGPEIFNSSLYFVPGLGQIDQYDKKRPVPFAEYVPDRDFWYQLAPDLIGLVSRGYAFGTRDGIFEFEGSSLGVLICFEIAIDGIGRELVSDGAEIILSQTNNADFGRSDETFQQAALARLRAIETGRTIVNISTVGVSLIFLPNGEIVSELPIFEPGVMVETVPLRTSITPAMSIGPMFDLLINTLAIALLVVAAGFGLVRRSRGGPD
jgi:apolipoprotein N-acyltransferase